MKKNGFTLIEIIGAIVILGIIAVLAFSTYTNSLRGFRDNYYTNLVRTLDESAEEFFNDYRNYRPNKILSAQKVTLSTLQSQNYLSKISDYNGKSCENSSYVLVVKEGKNKYTYHTCLRCPDDEFDNTEDMYCDASWLDPTKVIFTLGDIEDLYVYKGILREELEEKLQLPVSYTRIDYDGNELISVRGTGDGEPIILPKNMDVVNTNEEGTYEVEYEYKDENRTRNVIVYENEEPEISIKKVQKVLTNLNGTTTTYEDDYVSGKWAQKIVVNLNSNDFVEDGVETQEFQWNKGGRWQEFCKNDPCEKEVDEEMEEEIKFRLIDSNGKISRETDPIQINIDHTKPKCTLTTTGTLGNEQWYVTNVGVAFSEKIDQDNDNHIKSSKTELSRYDIFLSGSNDFNRNSVGKNNSKTHTEDTSEVTYVGYVEDAAENFNTCSITFKKDATPPTCEITGHANVMCQDVLSKLNGWYFGKTHSSTSFTNINPAEIAFSTDASTTVTTSGTYYVSGKDVAGNVSERSYMYYDVTYDKNKGSGSTNPTTPTKTADIVRSGNSADLLGSTSTREGYQFIGWNTSKTATSGLSSHIVTSDTTLYAVWQPNTYTIRFVANIANIRNNLTGSTADKGCTFDSSCKLTKNGFIKRGYTFIGWSKTELGDKEYNDEQNVTNLTSTQNGVVTLYGKWQPNPLVFVDRELTATYNLTSQTIPFDGAENGTGDYTYTEVSEIKEGVSTNYISVNGTNITISGGTPVGIYTLVVKAHDEESQEEKNAVFTIRVNKKPGELQMSNTVMELVYEGTPQTRGFNYIGDGTLVCESSNTNYAACRIVGNNIEVTPVNATNEAYVTIKLKGNEGQNYLASNEISFQVIVERKSIAFPTCSSKEYIDGNGTNNEQILFEAHDSGLYTNSVLKGVNAGNYSTNLTPTSNYQWNSGNNRTQGRAITCTITKKQASVNCKSVTYSGETKTLANGVGCSSLSNNEQINAGTYTVTCNPDNNHTQSSNECTLQRKSVVFPTCNDTEYNGSTQTLFEAHTTGEYTNNAITGKNVGTYNGDLTPTSNYQWSNGNATSSRVLSCSIVTSLKAKITCTNPTYNGYSQTIATCSGGTISSNATQTNVTEGGYTITCTGDVNHQDADSKVCNVIKAQSSVSCNAVSSYTGNPQTLATGVGCVSLSNNTQTEAGEYTVTCNPDINHTSTYNICPIPKANSSITCTTNKIYNGNEQQMYSDYNNCTPTTNAMVTNAGSYVVVCEGGNNYSNSTCGAQIGKRDVTLRAGSTSRKYNGNPLTNSYCSGTNLVSGQSVTCTMTSGSTITNVGSVNNVINTYTIKKDAETVTNNYNVTTANGTLEVTVAKPTVTLTAKTGMVYNGSPQVANTATVTLVNSEIYTGGVTYTYYSNSNCTQNATTSAPTNAGTYYVKATTAAFGNYDAGESSCVSHDISPATPSISLEQKTGMVYNGSPQVANIATVTPATGGAITYSYYDTSWNPLSSAPTNAGYYVVVATVAANGNYGAASVVQYHTISPATPAVTLTAKTGMIYNGNPQGSNYATVTLVNNEVYTGQVAYVFTDNNGTALSSAPTNAGMYYVQAIVPAYGNYGVGSSDLVIHYVAPATPTVDLTEKTGLVYNGNPQVANNATVTLVNNEIYTGEVIYEYFSSNGTPLDSAPTNADNYFARAHINSFGNYTSGYGPIVSHNIAKSRCTCWFVDDNGQEINEIEVGVNHYSVVRARCAFPGKNNYSESALWSSSTAASGPRWGFAVWDHSNEYISIQVHSGDTFDTSKGDSEEKNQNLNADPSNINDIRIKFGQTQYRNSSSRRIVVKGEKITNSYATINVFRYSNANFEDCTELINVTVK